jgi:hypothetical protein
MQVGLTSPIARFCLRAREVLDPKMFYCLSYKLAVASENSCACDQRTDLVGVDIFPRYLQHCHVYPK